VGCGVLFLGIVVQLSGFIAHEGWLLIVAIVIGPTAYYLGRRLADGPVTSRLHGQAVRYWRERSRS
jgi:hypothetical protein